MHRVGGGEGFSLIGPPQPAQNLDQDVPDSELIKMLVLENNRLNTEIEKHKVASWTMARLAISLITWMQRDDDNPTGEIEIPSSWHRRYAGALITLGETADGDILARVRDERIQQPGWEGK